MPMAAFATTSLPTIVPYRILFCIFVKHFISNLFSGSKNYVNKFYNLYQVIEFKVVLLIFKTSFWGGSGFEFQPVPYDFRLLMSGNYFLLFKSFFCFLIERIMTTLNSCFWIATKQYYSKMWRIILRIQTIWSCKTLFNSRPI